MVMNASNMLQQSHQTTKKMGMIHKEYQNLNILSINITGNE